jgi:hypothetical protein
VEQNAGELPNRHRCEVARKNRPVGETFLMAGNPRAGSHHRSRIRQTCCREIARSRAVRGHAHRSLQLSSVSAIVVASGDGCAFALRHRDADPHRVSRRRNVSVMLANVTAIDNDRNDVIAEGLRIPFDYHAAWAPDAPGLKTIDDAINLRRRILLAASAAVSSRPLFISAL